MNDLIDRNSALKAIRKKKWTAHDEWKKTAARKNEKDYFVMCAYKEGVFDGWNDAETEVMHVSSAETKHENHAHWIDLGGIYSCSNCGAEDGVETRFCSSCGYQMDGEMI